MPIYEYACEACGHRLEAIQKISDEPLKDCPECGKSVLTKLVSASGFRLSGGGWYETDFKSGSKRNLKEVGEAKPAKPESKPESKPKPAADSKPTKAGATAP